MYILYNYWQYHDINGACSCTVKEVNSPLGYISNDYNDFGTRKSQNLISPPELLIIIIIIVTII